MRPAVSAQENVSIAPAWLRPSALALATGLHLTLFVGTPWPSTTNIAVPTPLEIQVIPQGDLQQALAPVSGQLAAEAKPDDAMPVDSQAVEATASIDQQEIVETTPIEEQTIKPAERLAEIDPPNQDLPVPPEQPAAELPPLEAPRLTNPVNVEPPARETLAAEASALAVNPPIQVSPAPSVQPATALLPIEAPRLTAPIGVEPPAREAPAAETLALAINPPIQVSPAPSEQPVAALPPLEVPRLAAPVRIEPPAREAPAAETLALAINPPSQISPVPSEQPAAALPALEAPRLTAPVRIEPPAHEVPAAEASALAINPPGQASLAPTGQPAAELQPNAVIAGLPPGDEAAIKPSGTDRIWRYLEQYNGGDCFFVAPVAVDETSVVLQGLGTSAEPFEALDTAFLRDIGFEASIGVRLVTRAQCPAITFLGRTRASAPHLDIDSVNLRAGDTLTGTVDGYGSRNIELLLVSDTGFAQNLSNLLKPGTGTGAKAFSLDMRRNAGPRGGQPQLLIAVASPLPLEALRPGRPVRANQLFAAALSEAAKTGQPVAAIARYFKLDR